MRTCLLMLAALVVAGAARGAEPVRIGVKAPEIKPTKSFAGPEAKVTFLRFLPGGKEIILADESYTIRVYDVATGKEVRTVGEKVKAAPYYWLSPEGSMIARLLPRDNGVEVLNTLNGKRVAFVQGHRDRANCAAFSPDGKTLLTGGTDNQIQCWEVLTGENRWTRSVEDKSGVRDLTFAPDGDSFLSKDTTGRFRLWDSFTGLPIRPMKETSASFGGGGVWSPYFMPDGETFLLAGTPDGGYPGRGASLRMYEILTGEELYRIPLLPKSGGKIVGLCAAGTVVVQADGYGSVSLRDIFEGRQVATLTGSEYQRPDQVDVCTDASLAAAVDRKNEIAIWPLPSEKRPVPRGEDASLADLWGNSMRSSDGPQFWKCFLALQSEPDVVKLMPKRYLEFSGAEDRFKIIANRLADLDSGNPGIRGDAKNKLADTGLLLRPTLVRALRKGMTANGRRAAEELLEGMAGHPMYPSELHRFRGVRLLEAVGTPEARERLELFVAGPPTDHVVIAAEAALTRMKAKDKR